MNYNIQKYNSALLAFSFANTNTTAQGGKESARNNCAASPRWKKTIAQSIRIQILYPPKHLQKGKTLTTLQLFEHIWQCLYQVIYHVPLAGIFVQYQSLTSIHSLHTQTPLILYGAGVLAVRILYASASLLKKKKIK